MRTLRGYEFRSNSGPCLIYTPWQRLPDVSTHEIRLDLNLYLRGHAPQPAILIPNNALMNA